ncbi:MAG: helix-turn-helix domain-containing protein [Stackebrandtia sp.]
MRESIAGDLLMTPRQVEETYGIPAQTLANWRWLDQGPAYTKGRGRSGRVRYRRADIEAWLTAHTVRPEGAI